MITDRDRRLYENLYGPEYKQEIIRMQYPNHIVTFSRNEEGLMMCRFEKKVTEKTKK